MVLTEVCFECIVVEVVLWLGSSVHTIADVASFVLLSTVRVQLVVPVESTPTETTLWMTFEPCLIYGSWIVVSKSLVFLQLSLGEQLVLVCEDFLVACTEITHGLLVDRFDVTMKVRPPKTGDVTFVVWAVVSQKQQRVLEDFLFLVLDTEVLVDLEEVRWSEVFKSFHRVIGEDNEV